MARLQDLERAGILEQIAQSAEAERAAEDPKARARLGKQAEALVEDFDEPEKAAEVAKLTHPETIARKALGEFEE